ncbi:hypothetical protein [Pararhodospirillum oryzae]|uniref:Uncharacterized protein n=1 Tax=Pararhodospirillum oryzae TaxID=478448 RepID=A0A512H6A8_9PROT|nr:hypothetical protein [Pararhodospirillum oryzae]GEO80958.1 hypothetical protein ROR02_10890 [Pararhodospirillum oryzae]
MAQNGETPAALAGAGRGLDTSAAGCDAADSTPRADRKQGSLAKLTVITAAKPARLAKSYRLDADGKLVKAGAGQMVRGRAEVVTVSGLDDLAAYLELCLGPAQALTYGLPARHPVDLVPHRDWVAAGQPHGQLPRTLNHFSWPSGPGVMMLDHDPAPGATALSRDDLVAAIRTAAPGLADAAMLWWCSASSHIIHGDTGEDLTGLRGQRLYILVADASDIPRGGAALVERLWAAGYGHIRVSQSGQRLERTVIDASVWQTNRFDFAAGAACEPPLRQERGAPVVIPGAVEVVDTRAAIPDPDAEVRKAADTAKANARAAAKPEADRAAALWADARARDMVAEGATEGEREAARRTAVQALEKRTLAGDWPLIAMIDGTENPLTVGQALDDPDRWHGVRTLDPLEPDYDGRRAVGKLYLIDSRPHLYSLAHGGMSYRLVRQPARIEIVKGQVSATVDEALRIMRASPDLYDFGGTLAHVEGGQVRPLDEHTATYHLGRITQFWRWHRIPKGEPVEVLEDPPARLVKMIVGMGAARGLKRLDAVITAPTIRPDKTVLDRPGFDAETGLLLEPSDDLVEVPDAPTHDQVREAVNCLLTPFAGFPLVGPGDWGVLLAAILTAVARPALPTAPGFAFDAPVQGSGKTLLAKTIGTLAAGREPQAWPHTAGRDDEETRKRLFAMLRTGDRVLLWDNVIGRFESAALATALTAPMYTDRVLGKSESPAVPNRALLLVTGNNLSLGRDLSRRILVCRIDPRMEKPWLRKFDLEPVAWVQGRRQAMVAAALTVIRGYWTGGCGRAPGAFASFEPWDDLVRQPVAWIGRDILPGEFGDPVGAVEASTTADPDEEATGALFGALRDRFGDETFLAKDVAGCMAELTPDDKAVSEAIREILPSTQSAKSIGKILRNRRDRIVCGLAIRCAPDATGTMLWRIAHSARAECA